MSIKKKKYTLKKAKRSGLNPIILDKTYSDEDWIEKLRNEKIRKENEEYWKNK